MRIHHNLIVDVSDDGLEPCGAEEDCHWNDNIIIGARCGFRIKVPRVGPMYAYRNIFFNNGEDFRNFGDPNLLPARVYVYHNTSTARSATVSNKIPAIGTPNYHYFNNLFWCNYWWKNVGKSPEPNWKGDYNVYVRREDGNAWNDGKALAAKLGLDAHSVWTTDAPGFVDANSRDVRLTETSPARGRGADLSKLFGKPLPGCEPGYFTGSAPDCGAIQFGKPMPVLPRKPSDVNAPPAGTWPPEPSTRPASSRAADR
jgi:hypothetical protein